MMHKLIRPIALFLCVVMLTTCVLAAEPVPVSSQPEQETEAAPAFPLQTEAPEALPEAEPAATEAPEPVTTTEPEPVVSTEPTEPLPTEPTEPEPTDPEPTDPEPTDPEPTDPEPTEPDPEIPVSDMTDQQIIEKYQLADNWSRVALIFAVRNGIFVGKSEHNLAPKDNTTHAELATIIMRLLNTLQEASLSRFTDLKAGSWYYGFMARVVSLGIFPIADANATTLTPKKQITREEAFVALARTFGIHGRGRQAIYEFSDWQEVSDWAAEDISALIDAGFIAGSNGRIMPKKNITRQELAQIIFRQVTKVTDTMEGKSFSGRLALGSDQVPVGTTIDGDLLLSNDSTSFRLENLTVTGKLILQGNNKATVRMKNCSIHELVVVKPVNLNAADSSFDTITVHSFLKLKGSAKTVNVYDQFVLLEGGTVTTLNAMEKASMTIMGTVKTMNVLGDKVYVNGDGKIEQLNLRGRDFTNRCQTGKTTENPYRGVEDIKATRTDSGTVTDSSPTLKLSLKLSNMPEGWSEADLAWFVDGQELARTKRNLLKEGSVVSQSCNFRNYFDGLHESVVFTVYITINGKQALLYKGYVDLDGAVQTIAQSVRTQNVQGRLRRNALIYSDVDMTKLIKEIPKGTQVTILMSKSSTATKIRMQDGTVAWTSYYAVEIVNGSYYTTKDYSTAVKEYYVNKIRDWGSSTGYMIWVSLYTQRFNVFQGYRGHWRLIRTVPIASGRNDCPTPVEDAKLLYHTTWNYPAPGHNPPFYCHHVTVFDTARGFHSRPTKWGEPIGSILYDAIGYPASAGCIRMLDEDCIYIHDKLPLGTAVHIY